MLVEKAYTYIYSYVDFLRDLMEKRTEIVGRAGSPLLLDLLPRERLYGHQPGVGRGLTSHAPSPPRSHLVVRQEGHPDARSLPSNIVLNYTHPLCNT